MLTKQAQEDLYMSFFKEGVERAFEKVGMSALGREAAESLAKNLSSRIGKAVRSISGAAANNADEIARARKVIGGAAGLADDVYAKAAPNFALGQMPSARNAAVRARYQELLRQGLVPSEMDLAMQRFNTLDKDELLRRFNLGLDPRSITYNDPYGEFASAGLLSRGRAMPLDEQLRRMPPESFYTNYNAGRLDDLSGGSEKMVTDLFEGSPRTKDNLHPSDLFRGRESVKLDPRRFEPGYQPEGFPGFDNPREVKKFFRDRGVDPIYG
tara:strand:+ start:11424 stop:12230 length:807 start_codon:yes stop_codon:yes gene_type:complete